MIGKNMDQWRMQALISLFDSLTGYIRAKKMVMRFRIAEYSTIPVESYLNPDPNDPMPVPHLINLVPDGYSDDQCIVLDGIQDDGIQPVMILVPVNHDIVLADEIQRMKSEIIDQALRGL